MTDLLLLVVNIIGLILAVKVRKMEEVLKVFAQGIGDHQGNLPTCTICQAVKQSRKLLGIK